MLKAEYIVYESALTSVVFIRTTQRIILRVG